MELYFRMVNLMAYELYINKTVFTFLQNNSRNQSNVIALVRDDGGIEKGVTVEMKKSEQI